MKEHKYFNMRRLLTVVLMLALVLSTAATGYAADLTESVCEDPDPGKVIKTDWTNFRGNHTHNAVTKSPVPTKAPEAALLWATKSGSGYGGQAVGSPILVDGYLYYNQGKTINKIIADTGAKIDIEDDGRVFIAAVNSEMGEAARKIIEGIVKDPEVGEVYYGKVVRIMDFGAFVEFLPGKDGLVHISKLDKKRVEKVEDVVSVGDDIKVQIIEIDKMGRINLKRIITD